MKIIALGDIHGRSIWKDIVDKEAFDKIVFIGDYFDSREPISGKQQRKNFEEIISFKKANKEQVMLLLGNHDFHYLEVVYYPYSGYQPGQKKAIRNLLNPALDDELLQICFAWENLLFSHAGITKTWCKNQRIDTNNISESINRKLKQHPEAFDFTPGQTNSPYGDDPEQTPLWVRPDSLVKDKIDGYQQIVGHTTQDKMIFLEDVILIDTLGTSGEYFVWEDGRYRAIKF